MKVIPTAFVAIRHIKECVMHAKFMPQWMLEWGEQEDGTFHLSIPDDQIRDECRTDYAHDVGKGNEVYFPSALLEDMTCNSEYVLTTPLSIYLQSLQSMDNIIARGGTAHSAQCAEYAAHPNFSPLGWKMSLMPDQPLIAVHDSPDDGVLTQVDKIWVLPMKWLAEILDGEVVIAHSAPTTGNMQQFLDNLARRHTSIHWSKDQPGFVLGCSHQGNRFGGYMYGKRPTKEEFEHLISNEYIQMWEGPWDGNHYLCLTEKGLLATGRTLVDTYIYQQEYDLDMMENNMFMREDTVKIWAVRENIRQAKEMKNAEQSASDE